MAKFYQFYRRLLHAKAFAEKGADYFFEFYFPKSVFWNAILGRARPKPHQLYDPKYQKPKYCTKRFGVKGEVVGKCRLTLVDSLPGI